MSKYSKLMALISTLYIKHCITVLCVGLMERKLKIIGKSELLSFISNNLAQQQQF